MESIDGPEFVQEADDGELPGIPLSSGFEYIPSSQVPTANLSGEGLERYLQSLKDWDDSHRRSRGVM